MGPVLDYHLVLSYYFGNAAHPHNLLTALPYREHTRIRVRSQNITRHRTYLHSGQMSEHCKTQNILAYGSDLRTLQNIARHLIDSLSREGGKNSSFSQTLIVGSFIWLPGMKSWMGQASQLRIHRQLDRLNLTEPINQCNLSISYMGTSTLE
jgi:hypothetical protein